MSPVIVVIPVPMNAVVAIVAAGPVPWCPSHAQHYGSVQRRQIPNPLQPLILQRPLFWLLASSSLVVILWDKQHASQAGATRVRVVAYRGE